MHLITQSTGQNWQQTASWRRLEYRCVLPFLPVSYMNTHAQEFLLVHFLPALEVRCPKSRWRWCSLQNLARLLFGMVWSYPVAVSGSSLWTHASKTSVLIPNDDDGWVSLSEVTLLFKDERKTYFLSSLPTLLLVRVIIISLWLLQPDLLSGPSHCITSIAPIFFCP